VLSKSFAKRGRAGRNPVRSLLTMTGSPGIVAVTLLLSYGSGFRMF